MFLYLDRIVASLTPGGTDLPDAPADEKTYGRLNATWFDTAGIRPFGPPAAFDFNDTVWQTRTGNYSAVDVVAPGALANTPFETITAETYDFILEAIAGDDGAKQQVTVRSTHWEGERFYIRSADALTDITTVEWKELLTFYGSIQFTDTVGNAFQTVHTHALEDDTVEQVRYDVYGQQTAGGVNSAYFTIAATVENVAGVSVILGATVGIQHKSVGAVFVQVVDDGSDSIFVQVKPTNNDWSWRVEAQFTELRLQ